MGQRIIYFKFSEEKFCFPNDFHKFKIDLQPFGSGMVTVFLSTQIMSRGEGNLYLWRLDGQPQPKQPVHTFVGHTNVVLDFNWRRLEKGELIISSKLSINQSVFVRRPIPRLSGAYNCEKNMSE